MVTVVQQVLRAMSDKCLISCAPGVPVLLLVTTHPVQVAGLGRQPCLRKVQMGGIKTLDNPPHDIFGH